MSIRWKIKEKIDTEQTKSFSKQLNNLNETLATILLQRGISDFEQAKNFFRPELSQTHNPFLMKDMEKAVERLNVAIKNNQKILIFGDYDVDGTTSVSLVYSYLSRYYNNLGYYIPDRYTEGYGISIKGIDYAADNNFSLIIALDCGIKAIDKVAYAKQKNIDFIICDHHQQGDQLPDAVAVLDPKRKDCDYPFKELSGCGVGYKFMQAWSSRNNINPDDLLEYLDLLAISICSDIVPIVDENRVFTYFGIKQINEKPRPGIEVLFALSRVKEDEEQIVEEKNKIEWKVEDVVFIIAPRINAAGRLETGNKVVELLTSADPNVVKSIGRDINILNKTRKEEDKEITRQALEIINSDQAYSQKVTTVVYDENWKKGVIGIVASRLMETHYRPTIVLTQSDGKATGSARSVRDFDLYQAIDECSDLLEQFGGHKYAAGLTLKIENILAFSSRFNEVVSSRILPEMLEPSIDIDSELNLSEINDKFIRIHNQLAPFGPGNMQPVFFVSQVYCDGEIKLMGEDKEHIRMSVAQKQNSNQKFTCIGFKLGKYAKKLESGVLFDMAFSVDENFWKGKKYIQLSIKDIRIN